MYTRLLTIYLDYAFSLYLILLAKARIKSTSLSEPLTVVSKAQANYALYPPKQLLVPLTHLQPQYAVNRYSQPMSARVD